mgnify:CR=1 FL=1
MIPIAVRLLLVVRWHQCNVNSICGTNNMWYESQTIDIDIVQCSIIHRKLDVIIHMSEHNIQNLSETAEKADIPLESLTVYWKEPVSQKRNTVIIFTASEMAVGFLMSGNSSVLNYRAKP